MKISLHTNGRTLNFSQQELLSKLKRLESLKKQFSLDEADVETIFGEAQKPTEGMYFKVNPSTIYEPLFRKKRSDFMQEWTRKAIVKALIEVKKKPEKYSKPFATFMPRKTWGSKTVSELKSIATEKKGHITNWVEQSLEWAQRISNGESWEAVCNTPDPANWYRLIIWKDNNAKIVGGSSKCGDSLPATTVFGNHCAPTDILYFTVPLITIYP